MPSRTDAPPAYLRIGKRRLRIPKRRGLRIALGMALVLRGILPPAGYILLPAAFALLSIDIARVRRWRRRMIVWLGRRRKNHKAAAPSQACAATRSHGG